MICEIIAIGTEVVSGNTLDTNSKFLSRILSDMGIEVLYHTSVDDEEERLSRVIEAALTRADLVITTGGLGPTKDDMSKEIISKVIDRPLVEDQKMFEKIKQVISARGREVTDNNRRQAMKPEGSKFLENRNGTAPGVYIENSDNIIVMLPGPPKELHGMFIDEVMPLLHKDNNIIIETINTIGIGESLLETKILNLNLELEYPHTEVATYASEGMVSIRLVAKNNDLDLISKEINEVKEILNKELKEYIFSYGNTSIEELVIDMLREQGKTIGFCESCTGGLLASKITKVSGSSDVFDRSMVTYSNQAKMDELNVSKKTLDKYGAVSKETAYEMAKGLLDKSNVDIAVSITGIAGPNSDATNKPVGLVYICVMDRQDYEVHESIFYGNRQSVQNRSCMKALEEVWKLLS